MAKSLLLISRQAPWSGPGAREALDIVLAGGAFDLPIGLLFLDDGVLQLALGQQASLLRQKDLSANLQALSLFGVDELFACSASVKARGLDPATLSLGAVQLLNAPELAGIIDRFDQVITL